MACWASSNKTTHTWQGCGQHTRHATCRGLGFWCGSGSGASVDVVFCTAAPPAAALQSSARGVWGSHGRHLQCAPSPGCSVLVFLGFAVLQSSRALSAGYSIANASSGSDCLRKLSRLLVVHPAGRPRGTRRVLRLPQHSQHEWLGKKSTHSTSVWAKKGCWSAGWPSQQHLVVGVSSLGHLSQCLSAEAPVLFLCVGREAGRFLCGRELRAVCECASRHCWCRK